MTEERYQRNIGTITPEENEKLRGCSVCVVGCGGLGGYVIEELARMGVGDIIAIDGDVFQVSNLNRQLISSERNLNRYKAICAQERIHLINPQVKVHPLCYYLTEENADGLISSQCNAVVDALDNIQSRRVLEKICKEKEIPLIHGAIAGWHGQVSVIRPGDDLFQQLYPEDAERGAELETGNPSFTPAVVASIQTAETIKVLLGKEPDLSGRVLTIDLMAQEYEIIQL